MKALQVTTTKEAYFVEQELKPSKTKEVGFAIDITKKKQTILGFGGAITDAAISVYETMDAKSKKRFFDLVYGEEGLAYNFARLTIGSCDFSKTIYDYAQKDDLSDFSLKHDEPITALVKAAQKKRPFHGAFFSFEHHRRNGLGCRRWNLVKLHSELDHPFRIRLFQYPLSGCS